MRGVVDGPRRTVPGRHASGVGVVRWRVGYPCQNLTLGASTNHTLRLQNLQRAGRLQEVVRRNLEDLERILKWNAARGLLLFRIGQHVVPFASHPRFGFDWEGEWGEHLRHLGALARRLGIRLSLHPGQYIQPGSPNPAVRERSLQELRYSARVLTLLGAWDGLVVLHAGGVQGDRREAARRLGATLRSAREVLAFLALENDDRSWSVRELVPLAEALGVPVVFDLLHHQINPGGLGADDAWALAQATWGARRPEVHLASQAPGRARGAHAEHVRRQDWLTLRSVLDGAVVDVMVEAKAKEQAALRVLRWTEGP